MLMYHISPLRRDHDKLRLNPKDRALHNHHNFQIHISRGSQRTPCVILVSFRTRRETHCHQFLTSNHVLLIRSFCLLLLIPSTVYLLQAIGIARRSKVIIQWLRQGADTVICSFELHCHHQEWMYRSLERSRWYQNDSHKDHPPHASEEQRCHVAIIPALVSRN
jgi:hypothetical protein